MPRAPERRTLLALCLAVLSLTVAMTGCLGGSEDPAADGTDANASRLEPTSSAQRAATNLSTGGSVEADGTTLEPLRFDGLEEPIDRVRWKNGSFEPQQSCFVTGCWTQLTTGDTPHKQTLDITDAIPPGIPVVVQANLTGDASFVSQIRAELNHTGADVYHYNEEATLYNATFSSVLVRDSEDTVRAVANAVLADPEGSSYQMRVTIQAHPTIVPAPVPVAVPVQAGANVTVALGGENVSGVDGLHWGPDDVLLERVFELSSGRGWTLSGTDTAGEHVVALTDGPGYARVYAPSTTDGYLRALPLVRELGDAHSPSPQGQTSWSFQVDKVPYAAGLYLRSDGPAFTASDADVELVTSNGTLIDDGYGCVFCDGDGVVETWISEPGDNTMVAGEWHATFSSQASANVEVGHLFLRFQR